MTPEPKPLTGRKVFAIAVAAFGVIVGANLALAYAAIETFPGLEVRNGYIASQSFERDRAAQADLGWRSDVAYQGGALTVTLRDRSGAPAPARDVAFQLGRPTTEAADATPAMQRGPEGWRAEIDLAPGVWRLDLRARTQTGAPYRQHLSFVVRQ